MPRIDPHVHSRDGIEAYKATIPLTLQLASEQGVDILFDMPNIKSRPVIDETRVRERLALVPRGEEKKYRLFVGGTEDEDQLREAVRCYDLFNQVVGIKTGVGELAIASLKGQQDFWRVLARARFRGPVDNHCEKESLTQPHLWNSANPISHTLARPGIAEIESVRDQIEFALNAEFMGHVHICHVSMPESVRLINEARRAGLSISCGVTPHHLMWDDTMMLRPDGLLYKMNPPLRGIADVMELRVMLKAGLIDWIETDHAPHATWEKMGEPYCSGYPSLTLYRRLVESFLPGLGLTEDEIWRLTYGNIVSIFGDKL